MVLESKTDACHYNDFEIFIHGNKCEFSTDEKQNKCVFEAVMNIKTNILSFLFSRLVSFYMWRSCQNGVGYNFLISLPYVFCMQR